MFAQRVFIRWNDQTKLSIQEHLRSWDFFNNRCLEKTLQSLTDTGRNSNYQYQNNELNKKYCFCSLGAILV